VNDVQLLVWDHINKRWLRARADADGTLITKPEGVYLEDDPTLIDEEQHRLRLTVDAKLLVDDPTTQALITDLDGDLVVVDGNVDTLLARLTAARAGYLDQLDFDLLEKLLEIDAEVEGLGGAAMRGTDLAELEADAAARYGVIGGYVDEIESLLKHATYGLAALEGKVDDLEPRLVTGLQAGMTLGDHLLAGNIVRNPGFETGDTTGWLPSGAGTFTVQGAVVKFGTYSAKLVPNAAATYYIQTENRMPCYAGRRVRGQAWMKADANITQTAFRFYWYDAGDAVIGYTQTPLWGGNYDWTFRKAVMTAPDEACSWRLFIRFTSGGVAGNGYVDGVNIPQAPMDGEIHEYAVHVSGIFPDDTSKTCTVTSGGAANAFGVWANLVDSVAGTLSAKFAASDGYIAAIHVEDLNATDNLYMLELRDAVTGEILTRMRFSKAGVLLDAGHSIRIRSTRILAGADIEYRMKDATGGKTALLHVRYYLV